MPRLSAVDQAFFLLETPERPMNVGVLLVLKPPKGSRRSSFADGLVAAMLECPVGPPFSYRLKPGPLRPFLALEEDEGADARSQVYRHSLPRGSSLVTLFRRICRIHPKLLPRDDLLWQCTYVHGPGRRPRGALVQDSPRAHRRHRLHPHLHGHRFEPGFAEAQTCDLGGDAGGPAA